MGTFGREPERASLRNIALVCLAAFGLAACITFVWLGMRAVMDIGGACADGGPFVPVQPCPDGVPLLLMTGMFGLFGFGALGIYAGAQVGGDWGALPLLGWPALFLSLGWNFLEYGFTAGGDEGLVWGWIVPGVIFVLMGGVPLWIAFATRRSGTPVAARFGMPVATTRSNPGPRGGEPGGTRRAEPQRPVAAGDGREPGGPDARRPAAFNLEPGGVDVRRPAAFNSEPGGVDVRLAAASNSDPDPGGADDGGQDPVDRLERLADLRRRGDITTDEFERFKQALLLDAERRS